MILKFTIICICTLLALCESAYVDVVQKCDKDDVVCLKKGIKDMLVFLSNEGLPEANVPRLDPLPLQDVKMSLLGLVTLVLKEGKVEGIKNCVLDDIGGDFTTGHTSVQLTCNDVVLLGKFALLDVNPAIANLTENKKLEGGGDIEVTLANVVLKPHFYYDFVIKNGVVHFDCDISKMHYDFEVGNVVYSANKLYLGEKDYSKEVTDYLNANSKFIIKTFGRTIFDIVFGIANPIIKNFFEAVPVNHLLTNDMSPYVKN